MLYASLTLNHQKTTNKNLKSNEFKHCSCKVTYIQKVTELLD